MLISPTLTVALLRAWALLRVTAGVTVSISFPTRRDWERPRASIPLEEQFILVSKETQ
jgi:hypothetical protein